MKKKSDCQPCLKMAMSFSYEIALVAKKVVACKKKYLVRFVYNKIQIGLDKNVWTMNIAKKFFDSYIKVPLDLGQIMQIDYVKKNLNSLSLILILL